MELFYLQSLLFLLLSVLYLYHYRHPSRNKPSKGFKVYPLLGSIPEYLRHRHRYLQWSTDVLNRCPTNTSVFRRAGKLHGVITASPANVEHMLKTNFQNYPKGDNFTSILGDFLGQGIFNADGELWKMQRKTASHQFNKNSLRNFVVETVRVEMVTRLIPILEKSSETKEILDLQDVLEKFAFDNVCKVAFSVDPGCLGGDNKIGDEFKRAFEEAATLSSGRFMHPFQFVWQLKKLLNVGSERRLKESSKIVHQFADNIIRSRMKEPENRISEDLLSRFKGNGENSAEFLRDVVISFIIAGRDTTSSALTWFFWLLSTRPDVERNVLKELEAIRRRIGKQIGETYSLDELREMHYLHAAISEALRLYPPVPMDSKLCNADDTLPDGTFVRKGWFVTYHTYAMGRMENVWGKDCREFRPERWLENGVCRKESAFRFPVFHGGARMCLGKEMAYVQMKSIAASVIERFEMAVKEKENGAEPLLSLTLRMKDGLPVRVIQRPVN